MADRHQDPRRIAVLQPNRNDPPADPVDAWTELRSMIERAPHVCYADYNTGQYLHDRRNYETTKKRLSRARCAALATLDSAIALPYDRAALAYACAHAYSGRLTWNTDGRIDYIAGQEPGTERRYAALTVLRMYLDLITGPRYSIGMDGRIYTQPQS